ncbi:Beta-TrCP [Dactylella cylindrospora]|nr:Beta-TrCP [Dactylella cylindrospora]
MNKFRDGDPNFPVVSDQIKRIADNPHGILNANQKQNLDKLERAGGASFASFSNEDKPVCLTNTRTDLLKLIHTWVNNSEGKRIFWLCGMAGTGKSTLSRTVAGYYGREIRPRRLCASFFFDRNEADCNNASRFCSTLATDLMQFFPQLKRYISQALDDDPYIQQKFLGEQFESLIHVPLSRSKLTPSTSTVIIVVDALDECESEGSIRVILNHLSRLKADNVTFRVFITSRPEAAARSVFQRLSSDAHEDILLHEFQEPSIKHDISILFQHTFKTILDTHPVQHEDPEFVIPVTWPGDDDFESLIKISNPLFISAATICRFISRPEFDPRERLRSILESRTTSSLGLDLIYQTVLNQVTIGQTESDKKLIITNFRYIVGTIILLETPLSKTSLSWILDLPESKISTSLRSLHSVLRIPREKILPVKTLHLSFREFLLSPEAGPFQVDEQGMHLKIAEQCIELLSSKHRLRKDICKLGSPGALAIDINKETINDHLSPDIQYACSYWVRHLKRGNIELLDDDIFHNFLKDHLLHWLEATSLLGISEKVVHLIKDLQSLALSEKSSRLSEYFLDIERFLLMNQSIIAKAPLQTYFSALLFSPEHSIVRTAFSNRYLAWVTQAPEIPKSWDPLIQTLEGHDRSVECVAFSNSGGRLASASLDGTIKIWDPISGKMVQTLKGHSNCVNSIAFSKDCKLASASDDRTIKLWDVTSGVLITTFEDHKDGVNAILFSDDGKLISASRDRTVKQWHTDSGNPINTLEGHSDSVLCIALSKDNTLASGSRDGAIKVWDIASGYQIVSLNGHTEAIRSMAFSKDNKLASASNDGTVKVWDTASGVIIQSIQFPDCPVISVAFLKGGLLLLGSTSGSIELWDAQSAALVRIIGTHSEPVRSIAYLHDDDRQFASASTDGKIKLWDVNVETQQMCRGQSLSSWPTDITFSGNGKYFISASAGPQIGLWDTATGTLLKAFQASDGMVFSTAVSADGVKLALVSEYDILSVHDVSSGALVQKVIGSGNQIISIAFSIDGKQLASASTEGDTNISLWDTETGRLLYTVRCPDFRLRTGLLGEQEAQGCLEKIEGVCVSGSLIQKIEQNLDAFEISFLNLSQTHEGTTLIRKLVPNFGGIGTFPTFINEWLMWGEERLLWFPDFYRPQVWDTWENRFVFHAKSGYCGIIAIANEVRSLFPYPDHKA